MSDPLEGIPEHLRGFVHADHYDHWAGALTVQEREEFLAGLQAEYDAGQKAKPVSDVDTPIPVPAPDKWLPQTSTDKPEDRRAEQGDLPLYTGTRVLGQLADRDTDKIEYPAARDPIEDASQEPLKRKGVEISELAKLFEGRDSATDSPTRDPKEPHKDISRTAEEALKSVLDTLPRQEPVADSLERIVQSIKTPKRSLEDITGDATPDFQQEFQPAPTPDLRALRDEVDRASTVMEEAAEILRGKAQRKSVMPDQRVAAKTEAQGPPSTIQTVWTFIRKFAAFGGAFLLGASWTMLQIDEYGFALVLLLLGLGGLSIQIYDWKGFEGHSRAPGFLKSVAVVLILFSLVYFSAVIVKRSQDKPWSNLLAQERNETPTGKVQFKGGETVTARIRQWGTSGEHDAFVIVNSIELAPIADDYRLLIICRAQDNKLDAREDLRIDKSAMFTISGSDQRLEVPLSQDTMKRLVPQGYINIYVLLVPAKINPKELRTIKEFTQNGAYVVGNPSMLVNATVENNQAVL